MGVSSFACFPGILFLLPLISYIYTALKVYFISGLAADSRIFRNIQLPEGYETVYLEWIDPLPDESLEQYAKRLAAPVIRSEPCILLGMSMGGMVAVEIAKLVTPLQCILISSVPVASDLPFYFHWAGKIKLQRWIPISIVKNASLTKRLFSTETAEDKKILRQIIRESDDGFVRWAMDAILRWKNEWRPPVLLHIHGSRDEMLPLRFTHPTHIIKGAGHLMIMNRAAHINELLRQSLAAAGPAANAAVC